MKARASSTTLTDLGEDRLVTRLTRQLPSNAQLLVGPGDDCAVVRRPGERWLTLLKTDAVIEGLHFTADTDPRRVGWKALARAVSDIAAMGGEPEHALISLAADPGLDVARIDALYAGLNRCARRFGIAIAGGETSRMPGKNPPLVLTISLTGRVLPRECILRSGGKPGHLLYVTGRLGGSITGKHLDFIPRLAEARWLVAHHRPSAMMDLSDGLGSDLPRLAKASGCGFALEEVPRTRGATIHQALADGEDFELLFAVPPRRAVRLEQEWTAGPFAKIPLTRIGRLTPPGQFTTLPGAESIHGFDHFASP